MQKLRLPLLVLLIAAASLANAQSPLRLVNVTPCRLVDTRQQNNGNGFQGTMTFNLPALAQSGGANGGCSGFSLATAQAYSLNVTLVPISHHRVGYLTIWPTGEAQPLVSLENSDGRTKANAAIVPAGTGGAVNVYVTDTTNVLIDIDAYFDSASDSSALAFYPLPPCRVVDTRNGHDGGTLQAGQERDFLIPGAGGCGIPSNAAAYSFNVTVIPPSSGLDYLTVWPQGETMPVVSTINDSNGTVAANAAIVPAGPDNKTAFYPHNNSTDLIVDTNGYFAPASPGTGAGPSPLSLFTLTPCRVIDTRNGIGEFTGTIPVPVVGSSCGVPGSSSEAFVFNATVVPDSTTHLSYLTLWPQGEMMPQVSTLNAYDGAVTSNMAIVPAGSGNNAISAFAGEMGRKYTNLILDISSYFAPVPLLLLQTPSPLPDGTRNSGYSVTLAASGGVPPYTWSLNSGSLPPGLSISSSGTISGTPTSSGTFNFSVQVQDSESPTQASVRNFQLTVNASQGALGITTTSLPNGTVNTVYNAVLTANGGLTPYAWNVIAGSLPAGLGLNSSTGQITGTPQAPGYSVITVQVTDAGTHTAMAVLPIAIDTGNSNGTLNGMYALTFTGYGAGNVLVAAGSLTFDGNGNITGGETDVNNAGHGVEHDVITGGTYSVASNGLGQFEWMDDHGGDVSMLVSIGDAENMRVIAYNQNGSQGTWGAGALRQQNPAAFQLSAAAGRWTFGFQGFSNDLTQQAGAGGYNQDGSGNLTNGQEDINVGGSELTVQFTGTATAPDANGRATLQLQLSNHLVLNYAVYVVSGNETTAVETDTGGSLVIITSQRQSGSFGNSIFHGKGVGRESRQVNRNGTNVNDASVVLISFDGQGNYSLTEDENRGGTLSLQQMLSDTYSVDTTTGRTVINGGGGSICYPVQQNQAYCVEASSNHPGLLFFQSQATGQQFNNAYLNGEYLGGSLPQYVSTTDSTIDTLFADGLGNGAITDNQSGPDGTTLNQTGTGTYSIDSNGHLAFLSSGGSPIAYGYFVGTDRFFAISTDANPRALVHQRSSAP